MLLCLPSPWLSSRPCCTASVCGPARSASALLLQNNGALNSSPVERTSSLSPPTVALSASPPQPRRTLHLIPADKHLTVSPCFTPQPHFHFFKQQPHPPLSSPAVHFHFFALVGFFSPHSSLLIRPVASSPSPPSAT